MNYYHNSDWCPYGFEGCKLSVCPKDDCDILINYLKACRANQKIVAGKEKEISK